MGGFKNPDEVDGCNWNALMHALDSMTFSQRCALAAKDLVKLTANLEMTSVVPTGMSCYVPGTGSQPTNSPGNADVGNNQKISSW